MGVLFDKEKDYPVIYDLQGENVHYARIIVNLCLNIFEQNGIDYIPDTLVIKTLKQARVPIFYKKDEYIDNNLIGVNIDNYNLWARVAYQLSHELCHYEIFMINGEKSQITSWIEETICEAFSLFFLKCLRDYWDEVLLFEENRTYFESINRYLESILREDAVEIVIRTNGDLIKFNNNAQNKRELRVSYRNRLYEKINTDNIMGLLLYRRYLKDGGLLLDTENCCEKQPGNEAVTELCCIQNELISFEHDSWNTRTTFL